MHIILTERPDLASAPRMSITVIQNGVFNRVGHLNQDKKNRISAVVDVDLRQYMASVGHDGKKRPLKRVTTVYGKRQYDDAMMLLQFCVRKTSWRHGMEIFLDYPAFVRGTYRLYMDSSKTSRKVNLPWFLRCDFQISWSTLGQIMARNAHVR